MGEQVDAATLFSQRRRAKAKSEVRKQVHLAQRSEEMVLPKLNNKGLQLSRLERTPDKREVGGSSPLKPIHIFLNENEQSEVRIKKNSTPHRAKRDDGVTTKYLMKASEAKLESQ